MPFKPHLLMENKIFLTGVSSLVLLRGGIFLLLQKKFYAVNDFCWLVRASNLGPFKRVGQRIINRFIAETLQKRKNTIFQHMLKTSYPEKFVSKYAISGRGEQDIFRDIIALKSPSGNEKGVILLKYAQTFDSFIYFFDVESLLNHYYFVLEPCWAGYCNTNILSWIFPDHTNSIVVQCYTREDHEYIASLQPYLVPVDLGPADWVNADLFKPAADRERIYDIVMVSNWAAIKRHKVLFEALSEINDRAVNVLLIGYPWGGRTSEDIRNEAAVIKNRDIQIEIKEKLAHPEVVRHLNMSKFLVFLTRKEGDNKALVEALFTDVPVIVYENTVGGASRRVNSYTGILSSYAGLRESILYMLDNYQHFRPRQWALNHTGSRNSTIKLDACLRDLAARNKETYSTSIVEKINSPNLSYKYDEARLFENDYAFIMKHKK